MIVGHNIPSKRDFRDIVGRGWPRWRVRRSSLENTVGGWVLLRRILLRVILLIRKRRSIWIGIPTPTRICRGIGIVLLSVCIRIVPGSRIWRSLGCSSRIDSRLVSSSGRRTSRNLMHDPPSSTAIFTTTGMGFQSEGWIFLRGTIKMVMKMRLWRHCIKWQILKPISLFPASPPASTIPTFSFRLIFQRIVDYIYSPQPTFPIGFLLRVTQMLDSQ